MVLPSYFPLDPDYHWSSPTLGSSIVSSRLVQEHSKTSWCIIITAPSIKHFVNSKYFAHIGSNPHTCLGGGRHEQHCLTSKKAKTKRQAFREIPNDTRLMGNRVDIWRTWMWITKCCYCKLNAQIKLKNGNNQELHCKTQNNSWKLGFWVPVSHTIIASS